jgi:phage baseplate assembly protein W
MAMVDVAFPYRFDSSGRTAAPPDQDQHIVDLIEQVLLTAPGERVNRPTFGSGAGQLVFAPNSDALAIAQQALIKGNLQLWLSDLISVQSVQVTNEDSTLLITVQYTVIQTQRTQTAQFVIGGSS